MGVSAGYPDIFIPYPVGEHHGLYIELKRQKGGVVSDAQKDWLDFLSKQGYFTAVTYGLDEAKNVVLKYFNELMPPAA